MKCTCPSYVARVDSTERNPATPYTAERSRQNNAPPCRRREHPIRAAKHIPSTEGRGLRHDSPSFGEQDSEPEWMPPEGATSRELGFRSASMTSDDNSPQSDTSRDCTKTPNFGRLSSTSRSSTPDSESSANWSPALESKAYGSAKQAKRGDILADRIDPRSTDGGEKLTQERLQNHDLNELYGSHAPSVNFQRNVKRNHKRDIRHETAQIIDDKSLKRKDRTPTDCGNDVEESNFRTGDSQNWQGWQEIDDKPRKRSQIRMKVNANNPSHHNEVLVSTAPGLSDSPHESDVFEPHHKDSRLPHSKKQMTDLHPRRCTCFRLHWYFTTPGLIYPDISCYPGPRDEFLNHAWQVAHCNAHELSLTQSCSLIVKSEGPHDWVSQPPF